MICKKQSGPRLTYKPAIAMKREVWISHRFCVAEPTLTQLVRRITLQEASSWAIIATAAEFEAVKKAANARRSASILGLATPDEVDAIARVFPASVSRHVFAWQMFLKFVAQPDSTGVALGAM